MRKFLTVLFVILSTLTFATSKINNNAYKSDTIYSYDEVDTKPTVEKGMESLYKKWNSVVKYPAKARINNIEGKLFVSFIVDEMGNITDYKVEEGLGYGCDEAAIKALIKTKLQWTPGIKDGKPVKVRLVLPFAFKLT
ncbi:energy transducer TonB [Rhodocytophaga rosea]|uniref:Energy transducer TonB n=1 Tax=Rhodocytophaga rosea TaxID=2704465 RepID=A0A6C0GHD7_9BACT|nr:energy transducer TonB [Rhodocytophaga rosea]QHT67367.1 energy transducer TonB [Rhodocytophaga rosea]QHT70822.1 energy transducer TonB [Rhodocytophaga rosea]